jgi:uncharacterized membrane protein YphA (DoxX/SURF4 family)
MFSSFPDEWQGAGLLLLRTATGGGFVVEGIAWIEGRHDPATLIAVFMIAVGGLLLAGSLSRLAASLAVILGLLSMFWRFSAPHIGLFETPMTTTLAVIIAVALVCLGPGAFSADARLFGRREIIIPRNAPHNEAR